MERTVTDNTAAVMTDGVMSYAGHRYVRLVAKNGDLYYTDDFYSAMYEKITRDGMNYVEAYNALGFDTSVLTEARANCAGARAVKKMANKKFFEKNPADYDSDTSFEEMIKKCARGEMNRDDLYANMAARLIVLESMNNTLKKKETIRSGEEEINLQAESECDTAEKLSAADGYIGSSSALFMELSISDCLRIFKVHRTTYYNWKNSTQKEGGRKFELARQDLEIKVKFIVIIEALGYVPGARIFHTWLFRDHDMNVSIDRCRRIMIEMNLNPKNGRPPSRKAKKKAGSHCHPCAALENMVCQDFYRGPRRVILTDITYLYTNEFHRIIYLCVFYDCFTKEALGWSVRTDMKLELVQEAYDMMMENHGDELRGAKALIHSDQGSQYTSTTFKQILSDEGFVQSMSERGNSQDNAPMESFFGRMKERIMNLIALCPDYNTAKRLINGYLEQYNSRHYQYSLAGLTPNEFYLYTKTGVYPLDEYYGVKSSELDEQKKLIDARIASARKRNEEEREKYRQKREREQRMLSGRPEEVVLQDQKLLEKKIETQKKVKERAEENISALNRIMEKTRTAMSFIKNAAAGVIEDLKNPLHWKNYPELSYVFDMNGLY